MEDPRDPGSPWDAPHIPASSKVAQPAAAQLQGLLNDYQVRSSSASCSSPIRPVVCLICRQASAGGPAGPAPHCTGDLIRKLTLSISTGRGKGTQTDLWSGSGAVLQASKTQSGYVTLYHYNSPLKALPRHLACVWTGESDLFVWQLPKKKEGSWEAAHCTGRTNNAPTRDIKTYMRVHVYTSFMWHETCVIALVYTVSVAHSGKQGWLHKDLDSAGTSKPCERK